MSPQKGFDARSKLGRYVFQMLDVSVKLKPDIRVVVVRVHNLIAEDPEDSTLRFKLKRDIDVLMREPRLSPIVCMLWKELPST